MDNALSGQTVPSGRVRVCFNSDRRLLGQEFASASVNKPTRIIFRIRIPKCNENDNQTLSVVVRVHLRGVWDGSV